LATPASVMGTFFAACRQGGNEIGADESGPTRYQVHAFINDFGIR
jgi:hypothetical protein